jgi:hypothetical protein
MPSLFSKARAWSTTRETADPSPAAYASDSEPSIIRDGDLAYTLAVAGNGSKPSYQEAVGAPVESQSPLGYHVSWITVIFLNVNQMVGTGIFSTPGSILDATGSVGLSLLYWTIGFFMAVAGFAVYLELASYFPNRSGAEVVYLEQAYPRPKYLLPIAFAVQSVFLSFSSSNAIGMCFWRRLCRPGSRLSVLLTRCSSVALYLENCRKDPEPVAAQGCCHRSLHTGCNLRHCPQQVLALGNQLFWHCQDSHFDLH